MIDERRAAPLAPKAAEQLIAVLTKFTGSAAVVPEGLRVALDRYDLLTNTEAGVPSDELHGLLLAVEPTPEALSAVLADLHQRHSAALMISQAKTSGLTDRLCAQIVAQLRIARPQVLAQLKPTASKAFGALTKAAKALPGGDQALDQQTVLAAKAGLAWYAAHEALDTLLTLGSIHFPPEASSLTPAGAAVVRLVDVPEGYVTIHDMVSQMVYNPQAEVAANNTLRRLCQDYVADERLTLVKVARGEYTDASLSLAVEYADLDARLARLVRSNAKRRHENPDAASRRPKERIEVP